MPPPLTRAHPLLASTIPLPPFSTVAVAVYQPATPDPDSLCTAHDHIELARRHVLSRNASPILLDNVLPSPRCGKDPILYLFLLTTRDATTAALQRLSELQLEHLEQTTQSIFPIQDLSSSEHAQTHAHFLEAVRSFILSSISEAKVESSGHASPKRLGDGFILERRSSSSDWASGWDRSANTRPIVHFRLQIRLSFTNNAPSHLVIHPIPVPTPYAALPSSANPGLPIILMPYGTPAYFISVYGGPSHSLIKQFRDSLTGLGTGEWEDPSPSRGSLQSGRSSFIIGWIRVENRQGEDKGTLFVWPSRLCLSYSHVSKHRQPLGYIPEIPAPLQSSPQLPAQEGVVSGEVGDESRFPDTALPFQYEPSLTPPHVNPLRAFQTFTMSKSKDIRSLANEVGGYVDSVVRGRERERERLKKERELAGANTSPKLARNVVQPAASTSAKAQPPVLSTPQVSHPTANPHPSIAHAQHAEAFYPSPPQSGQTPHAPPPDNTSPEMEAVSLPPIPADPTYPLETAVAAPPPPSGGPQLSRKDSYDSLFGDNSSGWGQSSNDNSYMDMGMGMDFSMNVNLDMNMNMDMDMDFDMNMDMPSSRTTSANPFGPTNRNGALTFEDAFTEDDFSFFDQPSKSNPPPPTHASINLVPPVTPSHAPSTPMDFDLSRPFHSPLHHRQRSLDQAPGASGPGPPLSAVTPWTPGTQDGATPGGPHHLDSVPSALDLLPFTPGGVSPDLHQYHPSPETPTVQLVFDHGHGIKPSSKQASPTTQRVNNSSVLFDPIPFSTSHRNNDEKYSRGKFAFLPSPSPEPGYDPRPLPTPSTWRKRYESLTDPRIGVVKQLIGAKRKASAACPPPKPHPHESDWMDLGGDAYHTPPSDEAMDVSSGSDSDEEDGLSITSDPSNPSPLQSRPCTPPPPYLPPGPSLLHLQFTHAPLLPLSTPLRSPGAVPLQPQFGSHMPTSMGRGSVPPFASVPTPVSPAAALGAASEQSKNLESAAHAIAVEFVENTLWAEVWRVNNQRGGHSAVYRGAGKATVWPDDLGAVAEVMRKVNAAKENGEEQGEPLCDIGSLFGLDPSTKLAPYETPSISVGKGDAVIQLLPTALRFWQKLGLGPKGGRKDIEVYALYEDADDQKRAIVDGWLAAAGGAYKTKHMGQFIRGCTNPANDALLPIRFDVTFGQTFTPFISNVINAGPPIVVILFVPVTSMTFTSPTLRSVLFGIKKALKNFNERQITFHFVPDSYLIDLDHSPRGCTVLDELCIGIYNRIHVEVERNLSRRMLGGRRHSNTIQLQEPTFTLARSLNSKVSLVRSAHTSLDVVDRFTFLHVGYQISPCRKWAFACCIDQRGEEHDLGLWLVSPLDSGDGEGDPPEFGDGERDTACERFVVDKVWSFAMDVARRVDVEWRVVATKLGLMTATEVEAWTELYAKDAMTRPRTSAPVHLILASADHNSPFTIIARSPSSTPTTLSASSTVSPSRVPAKGMANNTKTSTQFSDISAAYYAVFPSSQLSVATPPKLDVYSTSFIPEPTPTHPPAPHHGQEGSTPVDSLDIPTTSSFNPSTATDSPAVPFKQEYSSSLPHPVPFIPLASSILIRVPSSTSPISMLHIYIIKTLPPSDFNEPHSTSRPVPVPPPPSTQDKLTRDLTRNFYELSVLSSARFHLDRCESIGIDPVLPLHLSAVDAMRFCVECDWDEEAYGVERGPE